MKNLIALCLCCLLAVVAVGQSQPKKSKKNRNQMEKYLKANKIDYKKAENGLYYSLTTAVKEGRQVMSGDFVTVHYTGKLLDGKQFDSSKSENRPFTFQVGKNSVIAGWEQGIPLFKVGESGTLYIPSELGYGSAGAGDVIPPNSPLIFDIEVLSARSQEEHKAYLQAQRERSLKEQEEKAALMRAKEGEVIAAYIAGKGTYQQTASGLVYRVDSAGDGAQAVAGKNVRVHYAGYLLDGTKFDSSFDRGQPIEFPLGQGRVIRGWDEGIALFKVGGKGQLVIPSGLGYGARGVGSIPANSVLVFDIEVVEVK